VLEQDSTNYNANYNTARIYYNKGVYLILDLAPNASLEEIIATQDKCAEYFRTSLPYMEKAYQHDSLNLDVLEGLWGIYINLNKLDLALNKLIESEKIAPENESILIKLKLMYYNMGMHEKSAEYLNKIENLKK
jgi:tetratricopeptide (TPR) repeat protein